MQVWNEVCLTADQVLSYNSVPHAGFALYVHGNSIGRPKPAERAAVVKDESSKEDKEYS